MHGVMLSIPNFLTCQPDDLHYFTGFNVGGISLNMDELSTNFKRMCKCSTMIGVSVHDHVMFSGPNRGNSRKKKGQLSLSAAALFVYLAMPHMCKILLQHKLYCVTEYL